MADLPKVAESGYPVRESLAKQGLIFGGGSSAEFRAFIDKEGRTWGAIIKKYGITID
jgi:tripartite-type tricarboxylate transporter receptor subunit TctC